MNFINTEQIRFIKSLIKNKVRFIITGGQAALYYGVHRNTGYLDVLVEPASANGGLLIKALGDLNLKLPEIRPDEFEKELFLSFGFEPEAIDIMTKTPGIDFEAAYKNAGTVTISGLKVKMIAIRDLIKNKELLKRPGEKAHLDKYDAEVLKKIVKRKNS